MSEARIALSKDFMESYSRLPRQIQKKVREFTEKFQRDPKQSSLNFERVEIAKDPKIRSVRIDQTYRAIVVHPPKGDVFLCVWVDHHDDAYAWVRDRRFEVHPLSGTFQMFEQIDDAAGQGGASSVAPGDTASTRILSGAPGHATAPDASTAAPGDTSVPRTSSDPSGGFAQSRRPSQAPASGVSPLQRRSGLFDEIGDEDLLLAGVPEVLLASVRSLSSDADLDKLAAHLPPDASEMLYLLAMGYSLVEAMEEADRDASTSRPSVDVEDFGASLARPESQQQFRIVAEQADLDQMLDAPLEQWRIFLHPSQRRLVQMNANGPVRVLGGAGTGKTVVLMHRADYLATRVFPNESDRILVTTFTKNLALDLETNLRRLCGNEHRGRIEVTHLHSWAASFMRRHGHAFEIASDLERRELMEMAMTEAPDHLQSIGFLRDEWENVVQAHEVQSRDEYLTVSRVGRRKRLSRRDRADLWEVFARYRELLHESRKFEWADVLRETRLFLAEQGVSLPYRAVLCDEVQDMGPSALRLLRAIAPNEPNSLFLVGDGHQRIYGQPTSLGSCGIEIRGRSRRLKLNYRTTEQIRDRAVAVLEGRSIDDLDGGVDSLKGYVSLRTGLPPEIRHFASEADEGAFIVTRIREWLEAGIPPASICLAARTGSQLSERYASLLAAAEIPHVIVKTEPEEEGAEAGVRLATMHRMKGLEFSRVLLAGVQAGTVPLLLPDVGEVDEDAHELQERCLFYVASTRARDELVIAGYGRRSPFLDTTV